MIALHFIHTHPNFPHTICSILSYLWGKQAQILNSSIHSQPLNRNQNTENSSAATSAPIFLVHATQPLTTTFTSCVFVTDPSWWNAWCIFYPCSMYSFIFGVEIKVEYLWFDFQLFWTAYKFEHNSQLWTAILCDLENSVLSRVPAFTSEYHNFDKTGVISRRILDTFRCDWKNSMWCSYHHSSVYIASSITL